jgi:hypothetical protein
MTPRSPGVRLATGVAVLAAAIGVVLGSAGAAQEPPVPERGVTVVLEPVSGRVLVQPKGVEAARPLQAAERLPVGTTVEATHGEVRVTVARNDRGDTWSAVFSEGGFIVRQPATGTPVTTLRLTGPRLRDVCRRERATASATRRKSVRKLWGDGRGRFRTRGRYSAATVRGTRWLTADRCDGTVTRVVRGSVAVEDLTDDPEPPDDGRGPPPSPVGGDGNGGGGVVVAAGDSYVARPGR